MLDALSDALGYVGSSLDKFGPRPMRGLLAGRPRELASIVPFSDSLGLTDPAEIASGRDVTDRFGWTREGADDASSHAMGLLAEALIDPAAMLGAGAAAAKGVHGLSAFMKPSAHNPIHPLAALLGDPAAAGRIRDLSPRESLGWMQQNRRGALGLKYDPLEVPPAGLSRADPEWVNNKTWYHGTGTPGLTADRLDPGRANPLNLFGRGIYQTADEGIARSYQQKGLADAAVNLRSLLEDDDFIRGVTDRAAKGDFDEWISRYPDYAKAYYAHVKSPPALKARIALELAKHGAEVSPTRKADPYRSMAELLLGDRIPRPVVYQSQPSFGHVLDLDRPIDDGAYRNLYDALVGTFSGHPHAPPSDYATDLPFADLAPGGTHRLWVDDRYVEGLPNTDPKRLVSRGMTAEQGGFDPGEMLLLRALREAGYDAMTHTGGLRAGAGGPTHQVLIALDPNDVLGLGRRTPYRQWEAMTR